jgi:hypothetical protein
MLARSGSGFAPLASLEWKQARLLLGHRYSSLYALVLREAPESGGPPVVLENTVSGEGFAAIEARGDVWSRPVHLGRRVVLASGSQSDLRLWDVDEVIDAQRSAWADANSMVMRGLGFDGPHAYLAVAAAGNRAGTLISADSNKRFGVSSWMGARLYWEQLLDDTSVCALAYAEVAGVPAVVAGDTGGWIRLHALKDGTALRAPIKTGDRVETMVVHDPTGDPICFAAVNLAPLGRQGQYVVRAWNLSTGEEIEPRSKLSITGWMNKPLGAIALDHRPGRLVLYGGTDNGVLRAWAWSTGTTVLGLEGGAPGYVTTLATGDWNGQPVLAGGHHTGEIYLWSLHSGRVIRRIPRAHRGTVSRIVIPDWPGEIAAISGGGDGCVRIWGASMNELFSINLDEPVNDLSLLPDRHIAIAALRGEAVFHLP